MRKRFRRRSSVRREQADINITAFMNLMVILVPFLLITAVFSRIAILELNLPGKGGAAEQNAQRFDLELVVRGDGVEIGDRKGGLIRRIPRKEDGSYDLAAISEVLQKIKARFPDKQDITLLLEPDIEYDILVKMMDTVRLAEVVEAGSLVKAELFPDIAIGDAPPVAAAREGGKGR
ncbi:MAG TPA: biopolymer transporter ExbD [Thiotrichales bacterium]|nr:biopolymer transporter ExbD [Thiotrichales bacterium]